jgi:hypothetical protein
MHDLRVRRGGAQGALALAAEDRSFVTTASSNDAEDEPN